MTTAPLEVQYGARSTRFGLRAGVPVATAGAEALAIRSFEASAIGYVLHFVVGIGGFVSLAG